MPGNFLLRRFERTAKKRRWFQVTGSQKSLRFYLSWNGNLLSLRTGSTILKTNGPSILSKTFDLVTIVSDIERASVRYLWRAASLHRHGESLAATAPDLTVLRRHLHSLRKRGLLERAAVLQLEAYGLNGDATKLFCRTMQSARVVTTRKSKQRSTVSTVAKGTPRATRTLVTLLPRLTGLRLKLEWASPNLSCVPSFCEA